MKNHYLSFLALICCSLLINLNLASQNVGINTSNPTEPLEVGGMIYSNADGFKFPDGSVQTRALSNLPATDPAAVHGLVLLELSGINGPLSWEGYNNVVRVLDMDWNASILHTLGGGGMSEPPEISQVSVLKEIDMATVPLLEEFFSAAPLTYVRFYFLRQDTLQQQWLSHYIIELENVLIGTVTQFTEYVGDDGYKHLEKVSFEFQKIRFEYDWEETQFYQYPPD